MSWEEILIIKARTLAATLSWYPSSLHWLSPKASISST